MSWIDIVSRVVHILSAVTLGGGLFYLCAVQSPNSAETDDAPRRRWARLVMVTAMFLLLSGAYNFFAAIQASKADGGLELAKFYHPLMGVKILLALVVMFLASLLSGRSPAAKRMQANPARPLTIASVCVVLIIAIGGMLKVEGRSPDSKNAKPSAVSTPDANSNPT